MQLTNQKRLAARILGCGVNRVWVHPDFTDQVASAVQTEDIREFIDEGWIKAKPVKGTSRVRARQRLEQRRKGRQKGQGSRTGSANARNPKKATMDENCACSAKNTQRLQRRRNNFFKSIPSILPQIKRWFIPVNRSHAFSDGNRGCQIQRR